MEESGGPLSRSVPRRGGWRAALFIVVVGFLERIGFIGVEGNLIRYLTGPLGMSTAAAAAGVNAWSGTVLVLPLVGALAADSRLGRYRAVLLAGVLYLLGSEYELKDIVHWQSICEGPNAWYYHLNITMKTKGTDDDAGSVNQLFAEVTLDQSDTPGYFLSSFCRIDPNSKDVHCHGCTNNGSIHLKHPPTHFDCGHTDLSLGYDTCNDEVCRDAQNKEDDDEEEELREEEERIRESFNYLDDVEFMEKLRKKRAELLALHSKNQDDEETACKD